MADNAAVPEVQFLPVVRAPDFKYVFVNNLRMKVNSTEFTLYMGVNDELQPGMSVGLESIGVIMTPATVKSLAEVLTQTIEVFEHQHGEIQPPSLVPLDAAKMEEVIKRQKDKIERKSQSRA